MEHLIEEIVWLQDKGWLRGMVFGLVHTIIPLIGFYSGWSINRFLKIVSNGYVAGIFGVVLAHVIADYIAASLDPHLNSAAIGIVGSGGNVIPPVAYASYFGRSSIGNFRGVCETGVQLGQTIGPVLSGLAFDINGSYQVAFLTFAVLALIGAGLIVFSKPPKAL